MEQNDSSIDYGKLLPFASVFGAALALTFDVGYFTGIDINFFTFFSLAEHVLFSLEALPLALGICLAVILLYALVGRFASVRLAVVELWVQSATKKQRRAGSIIRLSLTVAFYSLQIYNLSIQASAGNLRAFLVYSVLLAVLASVDIAIRSARRALLLVGLSIIGLFTAFLIGDYLAEEYISDSKSLHTIVFRDGTRKGARVIRSGERGIMYVDVATSEIRFRTWENIELVTTPLRPGYHWKRNP